jgi:hypothetical protein
LENFICSFRLQTVLTVSTAQFRLNETGNAQRGHVVQYSRVSEGKKASQFEGIHLTLGEQADDLQASGIG